MTKETIIFYKEWLTLINSLPDKSRLEFYDLIFSQDKVVLSKIKDAHLRSVLDFVQQKIDKNHVKYKETIEKRREAGREGGKSFYKKDPGVDNLGECQFYVLRLFNEEENFVKIGVTSSKINRRFGGAKNMPYNYEIIYQIIDANLAIDLEAHLTNKLKNYSYSPQIKFPGYLECYDLDVLKIIQDDKVFAQAKRSKKKQVKHDSVNDNDNDNVNVNDNVSDKEINKKTKAKKDFFGFDIPAFIQKKTLQDFIENRKTLKKPVTENAMKRLLSSLEKLEAEGQDVNACIDNAILNGYSGVFPINQKSFNQNIAGYKNSYDPAKAKKDLDDVFNNLENQQRGNYAN